MSIKFPLGQFFIAITAICPIAQGAITTTTGAIVSSSAPASVQLGALESNTLIRAFAERQNFALPSSRATDVSLPGFYDSLTLSPGTVAAGTHVDSYLLHFDIVGAPNQPIAASGSITFNTPILGLEVLSSSLDATDGLLGSASVHYPVGESLRGLELQAGQAGLNTFDAISLSADRKTLEVLFSTQLSMDQIRIVTATVPEPSSFVLLGAGALGLLALRRRGRRV